MPFLIDYKITANVLILQGDVTFIASVPPSATTVKSKSQWSASLVIGQATISF